METKEVTIIKEVELCKDILWYLKGQEALSKEESIDCIFGEEYINALTELIYQVNSNNSSNNSSTKSTNNKEQ